MTRRIIMPPRPGSGSKRGATGNATPMAGRGGAYGKSAAKAGDKGASGDQSKFAQHIASYRKGGQGKKDEKNSSSAATMAARMMAQKMATRVAAKKKGAVNLQDFKGMYLMGMHPGHIDKKGRVYGAGNQLILKIDLKTGDIKTTGLFGRKIGKFNPKSHTAMNVIYRELEKQAIKYQAMSGMNATAPEEFMDQVNGYSTDVETYHHSHHGDTFIER